MYSSLALRRVAHDPEPHDCDQSYAYPPNERADDSEGATQNTTEQASQRYGAKGKESASTKHSA